MKYFKFIIVVSGHPKMSMFSQVYIYNMAIVVKQCFTIIVLYHIEI